MALARLNCKNNKTGKPVDSSFGAEGNLNKSRKNYGAVTKKSQNGGNY